ncbi:hypothetical protein ACLB2K_022962 [Fragaria x ananassa]
MELPYISIRKQLVETTHNPMRTLQLESHKDTFNSPVVRSMQHVSNLSRLGFAPCLTAFHLSCSKRTQTLSDLIQRVLLVISTYPRKNYRVPCEPEIRIPRRHRISQVTFSLDSIPFCASAALVSFADHCTSFAADNSTPPGYAGVNSSVHSLIGYYHTSDGRKPSNILSQSSVHGAETQNSIVIRFWYNETADEQGLFRVQGSIEFPKDTSTYFLVENSTSSRQATDIGLESVSNVQDSTSFKLNGIWSEASGKLCMVRSGYHYSSIGRFCAVISNLVLHRHYELKYPSRCLNIDFPENCSPISVSYLPAGVSLKNIECSEDEQKMRVLVDFSGSNKWNQRPFNPNVTFVGEGSWDATKNEWTIGNTSSIQGLIWSNQTAAESDYFESITFESGQTDVLRFTLPGQEYEYTLIDQVTKLCQRTKTANENNRYIYPPPFSVSMRFHHSVVNSTGEEIGWGVAVPLSFGNQFFYPLSYSIEDGTQEYPLGSSESRPPVRYNQTNPHSISYRIDIKAKEGSLCMVGCRDLSTNRYQQPTNDSIDCDIVVNFKFPPGNPKTNRRSFINGSIESTRDKYDPLYFERVELTAAAYYTYDEAERSIWRMDVEIILVLISNTLACFFGTLQLFHVKRHPEVLHSISTCMLYILGLGYLFPLTLNFNAMLTPLSSQTLFLGSNGWHEFNGLIVNVLTMVGFLLQLRLLQLTRSAREANGNIKELWAVEKLALLVALPVYVAGSLVMLLLMNWRKRDYIIDMVSRYQGPDIFGTVLTICAGLVLDGFLLPQIVLNIFRKSKEKSLAVSFFVGTTLVRVLPHAYDLYRDHTSGQDQLNESYIYASPAAYFYSTTWNVIVPCGGLLFAVIIYLQQQFGGSYILPHKLRESDAYEKVNIASEAS